LLGDLGGHRVLVIAKRTDPELRMPLLVARAQRKDARALYQPLAAAVKAFQTSQGLTADGIAGPQTVAAIEAALAAG